MILESAENGPLIWPTVEENGETNIILQGLLADIYSLVNHHRVIKDLWKRVQLLMQGGQARVVKCYNCQGKGHMTRKCTQPKQPRNAAWYKDKAMLAEAHKVRQILDEEQLTFLADPGVPDGGKDRPPMLTPGIDNDIYSIVDACPNVCEMWKAIKRLKQEWLRFMTLVKQSQELKTVSYHKLYDILKQHQNEVNKKRAERLAHIANPLALVAQQQLVYHPRNHPTHHTQNSSTDHNKLLPEVEEKDIYKLIDLISLSFKKIYKPTNNDLRTSSNTSRANQDNTLRINKGTGYDNQWAVNVTGAREHHEQPRSVNDTCPDEQGDTNVTTDSLDMSNNGGEADQDEDEDHARERDLLASIIKKLKYEID
nr:retrovirus-related Pol polyprotein from transposon TNT 1-94 [Tanacetum cinerariifolium]